MQISALVAKVAESKLTFAVGWQHAIRQAEGFPLPWHCQLTPKKNTVNSFACPAFDHIFFWSTYVDRNLALMSLNDP